MNKTNGCNEKEWRREERRRGRSGEKECKIRNV